LVCSGENKNLVGGQARFIIKKKRRPGGGREGLREGKTSKTLLETRKIKKNAQGAIKGRGTKGEQQFGEKTRLTQGSLRWSGG